MRLYILSAVAIVLLALWLTMPSRAEYQLLPGRVACPTKEGVINVRLARVVGFFAQVYAISQNNCSMSSKPMRVYRKFNIFSLVVKVELEGRIMYADSDAFVLM